MRRKLVKQGRNALTVTLPAKWTGKYGLKAGDEIEVVEKKSSILISTQNLKNEDSITINTKGYTNTLGRIVGATYKAGYNNVEFIYTEPEEVSTIQDVIGRTCIGFEITEQTKNRVNVRTLLKTETTEFDTVLRRCFLTLISIGEDSLNAMKSGDNKELRKIVLRDTEVNKQCDFCRRIINQGPDLNYKRLAPLYVIIEQLEKIGDLYKECICMILDKQKDVSKDFENLYSEMNDYFREFYELFYNFEMARIDRFVERKKKMKSEFDKALHGAGNDDFRIFFTIFSLFSTIYDLNGSIATLNI